MRPDIRPGGIFPDYALPDDTGTVRTLSELQGRNLSLGQGRLLEVSRLGPAGPRLDADIV
jgi:hypothetical protein